MLLGCLYLCCTDLRCAGLGRLYTLARMNTVIQSCYNENLKGTAGYMSIQCFVTRGFCRIARSQT